MGWLEEQKEARDKIFEELLDPDKEPPEMLIVLGLGDTSGMTASEIAEKRASIIAMYKRGRQITLNFMEKNAELLHYMAACKAEYGNRGE